MKLMEETSKCSYVDTTIPPKHVGYYVEEFYARFLCSIPEPQHVNNMIIHVGTETENGVFLTLAQKEVVISIPKKSHLNQWKDWSKQQAALLRAKRHNRV